jgi:hypothetical protein
MTDERNYLGTCKFCECEFPTFEEHPATFCSNSCAESSSYEDDRLSDIEDDEEEALEEVEEEREESNREHDHSAYNEMREAEARYYVGRFCN